MREWKYFPLLLTFLLMLVVSGCNKEKTSGETDAVEGATIATDAIQGSSIDTGNGDPEEPLPDVPDGDNPIPPPVKGFGSGPAVKPLTGTVTMDDLVYPTYDPLTGEEKKDPAPDQDRFMLSSHDKFDRVWTYYSDLLSKQLVMIEDNFGDIELPKAGTLTITREKDTIYLNVFEAPGKVLTMIEAIRK